MSNTDWAHEEAVTAYNEFGKAEWDLDSGRAIEYFRNALRAAYARGVTDEREACARVADRFERIAENRIIHASVKEEKQALLRDVARAIRSRSQDTPA